MAAQQGPEYGSDVMVDVLRALDIPYASINPGASFRGLHDSLVNWDGGGPQIITCPHEKLAVGLAHGYAKATGRPIAVVLHDLVGLLQATMGLYYAFHDRVPVLALGGSGPADTARRRPGIDWFHSANVQGNAVRDYVKWDDEPRSIGAMQDSLVRAWNIARAEPAGPTYVALDAALQEDPLTEPVLPFDPADYPGSTPIGADPGALDLVAALLTGARKPVIIAEYAGRDPETFTLLPELAELTAAAVIDTGARLNLPTGHRLNLTGTDVVSEADVVLFLDCKDAEPWVTTLDSATRETRLLIGEGAKLISLGFSSLGIRSWSHDFGKILPVSLDVTADTTSALPLLVQRCRDLVEQGTRADEERREGRRQELAVRHEERRKSWRAQAEQDADVSPLATGRLALEVWDVVKDYDWVLTAGTCRGWARKLWDFDQPYRHPGNSLGTATQVGISLGVALAHKGTGRLVVDLQPDGDLMFDLGALWVAAYYKIPMLVVMVNNRAYYNDWDHQEVIARQRGRAVENAYIGMEIAGPAPDFSSIARAQGWWSEGPIDKPGDVRAAVARAAEVVMQTGQPALVDVVTQLT
jgi:acetolactate synthase-1/2/3 large subunit